VVTSKGVFYFVAIFESSIIYSHHAGDALSKVDLLATCSSASLSDDMGRRKAKERIDSSV
jgi:hypothetical protein